MDVKITAHSGCDGCVMNSEAYILHALTLDIYALEIDIRRDPEGGLILTHNPPEAGGEYVSLEEAFSLVRDSRISINCDLKEAGLERDVLCLAGRMGVAENRIVFTGALTDWRDSGLAGRVWLNPEEVCRDFYEAGAAKYDIGEIMRSAKSYGYSVMNIDYRILNEAVIDSANTSSVKLSLWTIDDPAELPESLNRAEIINITTNYPSRIAEAMKRMNS